MLNKTVNFQLSRSCDLLLQRNPGDVGVGVAADEGKTNLISNQGCRLPSATHRFLQELPTVFPFLPQDSHSTQSMYTLSNAEMA